MNKIKKIAGKIILFIPDILLFAYHTVKEVVLPNRKRKGTIFSSFFIFFLGIIERLNHLEVGSFKPALFFKTKYVKQGVIIFASFLFLLSSFEWNSDNNFGIKDNATTLLQIRNGEVSSSDFSEQQQLAVNSEKEKLFTEYSHPENILPCLNAIPLPVKGYLFTCRLLI